MHISSELHDPKKFRAICLHYFIWRRKAPLQHFKKGNLQANSIKIATYLHLQFINSGLLFSKYTFFETGFYPGSNLWGGGGGNLHIFIYVRMYTCTHGTAHCKHVYSMILKTTLMYAACIPGFFKNNDQEGAMVKYSDALGEPERAPP